jgi:hypothetical protein
MTNTQKFPGISFVRCREKLGLRLRREPNFNKSFTASNLLWDKPEDHEKLEQIIIDAINETEWKPYNATCMKRLYINLYSKLGKNRRLQKISPHIKAVDLLIERDDDSYVVPKDDAVLTELRLIRNYLEKLTLLQEVKQ